MWHSERAAFELHFFRRGENIVCATAITHSCGIGDGIVGIYIIAVGIIGKIIERRLLATAGFGFLECYGQCFLSAVVHKMCAVGAVADIAKRAAEYHIYRHFFAGLKGAVALIGLELAIVVVHYRFYVHRLGVVGLH